MQRRLNRAIRIILFALACLAVLGCGSQQDTPTISTHKIQVFVPPQSDGVYPAQFTESFDGGDVALHFGKDDALTDEPSVTLVHTDTIQVAIPNVYLTDDASPAGSDASAGYRIAAFAVQEDVDGQLVRFSEFTTNTHYITDIGVVILVDNSDSLRGQLGQNRYLATRLGRALLSDPRTKGSTAVAVVPVNMESGQVITFTNNLAEVTRQAGRIRSHDYTPLYEALKVAIDLFDDYTRSTLNRNDLHEEKFNFEERFIVLISDGQDNSSANQTLDAILQEITSGPNPIKVWILAAEDRDAIREGALRQLIDVDLAGQTPTPSDRYLDLSALSPDEALERMTQVKDAIISSCLDRYTLYYRRSASIPRDGIQATFVITAEQKMPPASEVGGILRNQP